MSERGQTKLTSALGRLGGWWRLWIVLCVVWVALIAIVQVSAFPTDTAANARIGSDFLVTISEVPVTISDAGLISKLERMRSEEREYAKLVEAMVAGRLTQSDFAARTKALKFRPEPGWSTADAPPLGPITIEGSPRRRLADWAIISFGFAAGFPLALLGLGLSIRWVRNGFKRGQSNSG